MSENKIIQPIDWKPSEVEKIKIESNYLRGTLEASLNDVATGSIATKDIQLIKFHGSYQQTDRDLDAERKTSKLEPLYSFMIRVRVPGGVSTSEQYLAFDKIADTYGSGTLKLTTRQAYQFHGILKRNLKKTMKAMNDKLLDSIAACGDVNRNVMCTSNEGLSPVVPEVCKFANEISEHLLPHTKAYHEIWLDKKLVAGGEPEVEPIYGKTYLPRKFKIAIAIPPYNDVDVFSNDLGLIAIEQDGVLQGFNISVGGGFGTSFAETGTYPRLGDVIGYVSKDKTIQVVETIVKIQRDNGNRENRRFSRLKYTLDRIGTPIFIQELEARLGYELEPSKPYKFNSNGDVFGWRKAASGKWSLGLYIEHGRIKDEDDYKLKTGLREIAKLHKCDFRLTGNQGLVLGNVAEKDKVAIDAIVAKYQIGSNKKISALRRNSIACVALNTCTLAFAEAERYLPSLVTKIDKILEANKLTNEEILIRMTGCPNGCGRPFLGEIALIGRSLGVYNLYLGANFTGERLNTLYKEQLNEEQILAELKPLIAQYAFERNANERFGDFIIRKEIVTPSNSVKIVK